MGINLKFKHLMLLVLIGILAACASVQNTKKIDLPQNSIGLERYALASDMINSVDLFIERNLNCSTWSLEGVSDSKAVGQLVFTREGQIYRGKASEKWHLQQCGQALTVGLSITPDPQGGSVIRISTM